MPGKVEPPGAGCPANSGGSRVALQQAGEFTRFWEAGLVICPFWVRTPS